METPSDQELLRSYEECRTMAVVGASTSPDKAAHFVPEYLRGQGFEIIPANPSADGISGEQRPITTARPASRRTHGPLGLGPGTD